jgi:hypothetical protein
MAAPAAVPVVPTRVAQVAKPSVSTVSLDDASPVKAYSDQYPHVA